jgi:hypothetical protein
MEEAGLVVGRPVTLPGGPLTVKLWRGERPVAAESHQATIPSEQNFELFQ